MIHYMLCSKCFVELESQSRRENLRLVGFGFDEDVNDSDEQCATTIVNTLNLNFTFNMETADIILDGIELAADEHTKSTSNRQICTLE